MSAILYYSNYCGHCKELLYKLSRSNLKKSLHFVCIDKRSKQKDGTVHISLENGEVLMLPPNVKKVPSILLLHHGNRIIDGLGEIQQYLNPQEKRINEIATQSNGEPLAFSLASAGFGVASDNFSFLDQNSDSLSAKGDGGMRQQHHYATLEERDDINTPPEDYTPDTIGNSGNSMDKMQQERQADMARK